MGKAVDAALAAAKDLADRIMVDEGGMPPPAPSGHGGLISRETLMAANRLRLALAAAEKETKS